MLLNKVMQASKDTKGQMMVELAIVFPVIIIIAVIAVNALTFFSECAEFDRVGRNSVRMVATSPTYGQTLDQSITAVKDDLEACLDASNLTCNVNASQEGGLTRFQMTLEYAPTLFGMGLKSSVFGVNLPKLTHECSLVIDMYKPGVLL